jgi:hypothetical protein
MGAYCKPRWAQWGKCHSRLLRKKKLRVTAVTMAKPTMTHRVQASVTFKSVLFMLASLSRP